MNVSNECRACIHLDHQLICVLFYFGFARMQDRWSISWAQPTQPTATRASESSENVEQTAETGPKQAGGGIHCCCTLNPCALHCHHLIQASHALPHCNCRLPRLSSMHALTSSQSCAVGRSWWTNAANTSVHNRYAHNAAGHTTEGLGIHVEAHHDPDCGCVLACSSAITCNAMLTCVMLDAVYAG